MSICQSVTICPECGVQLVRAVEQVECRDGQHFSDGEYVGKVVVASVLAEMEVGT